MSQKLTETQSRTQKPLTSGSVEQLNLPSLWNDDGEPHPAWSTPATEDDVAEAAKYLITAVEPDASDQRAKTIFRLLKTQDYSRAELLLAMKKLPFDPEASHNYGRGFNPADVERIVEENRKTRARLQQPLSSEQRDEMIAEHPEEIAPDAFHCCGFNAYDEPQWRYAPNPDTKREDINPEPKTPNPDLGEGRPGAARDSSETDGDTVDLGSFLNQVQEQADQ